VGDGDNTQLGPKGGDGAVGRTRTLKTELAGLAKIGVITIGIDLILNRKSFTDAIKKKTGLDVNQSGLGLLNDLSGGRLKSGLSTITGGRLGGSGTSSKNPYPRGSLLWSLYEAGRVGEPFVPSSGNKRSKEYETQRTAYLQGARARTKGSTEPSAPGAARLKRVQRSVVATARRLGPGSGAVYVTGGTNVKTGYDCSGYLYDIYRKNGITIPRTSEAQWADPTAIQVPKGQEQPGDGVYFTGSSQYPPPGHCGIYVGGDKYIEYFSSGRPARVSRLSEASDYWGARRWIKIKQRAGTAGTTNRPTSGPGDQAKEADAKRAVQDTRRPVVRNAIAAAHGTKGKADDIRALRDEEAFLARR
jgi:cell wall-associated NlpC family hydrolase